MARPIIQPTGQSVPFDEDEIIVSKTDLKGIITYANDVFLRVSGYTEAELLGQPHNIIRHPDMPRSVFKLLWDGLKNQQEVFAYVVNLARNGDHYWVFAHVTPSYDTSGRHVGYHSNRRVPHPDALTKVKRLYAELLSAERKQPDAVAALSAGSALIQHTLAQADLDYSQFVFSLSAQTQLEASLA